MDVSAGLVSDTQLSFEDKLRQEVVLVPEDLADIHIESAVDAADTADTAPANHTRYGKGKHWKRNLKKSAAAAAANTSPLPDRAHDRATPRTGAANHR